LSDLSDLGENAEITFAQLSQAEQQALTEAQRKHRALLESLKAEAKAEKRKQGARRHEVHERKLVARHVAMIQEEVKNSSNYLMHEKDIEAFLKRNLATELPPYGVPVPSTAVFTSSLAPSRGRRS